MNTNYKPHAKDEHLLPNVDYFVSSDLNTWQAWILHIKNGKSLAAIFAGEHATQSDAKEAAENKAFDVAHDIWEASNHTVAIGVAPTRLDIHVNKDLTVYHYYD